MRSLSEILPPEPQPKLPFGAGNQYGMLVRFPGNIFSSKILCNKIDKKDRFDSPPLKAKETRGSNRNELDQGKERILPVP